jgi:HEAT repeat protein
MMRSGRRSLEAALRDLTASKARVRVEAATDLARHAQVEPERVVAALRRALGDEDARVRGATALALADAGAKEAVEDLMVATEDAHDHVVQMALTALGEIGDARAAETVARLLAAASAPVRFQAVMAFPRVCRERDRAVAALLAASDDDDALVRHIALRMAEELGADDGIAEEVFLARARELLDDESVVVQIASAIMLGRAGRRDGARLLVAVVAREIVTSEADDEAAAIELCGELGLRAAVAPLERRAFGRIAFLARDPFAWQARVALAALEHPRAVRWILEELRAWTRERRSLAVAAAGRARLARARDIIDRMRGDDARADQDAVEEALALIDAEAGPA